MEKGAQVSTVCSLCETNSKIQWKCIDCNVLMCVNCKEDKHLILRNARDHSIVELKEISNTKQGSISKKLTTCSVHEGQNRSSYCETCNHLICETCFSESHREHKTMDIGPILRREMFVGNAQVSATCRLCEKSLDIQWKCLDCNLLMCSKCRDGMHLRIRNARDHNVIHVKDSAVESAKNTRTDTDKVPCTLHDGQPLCSFCDTCDQLVCLKCVLEEHQGHYVSEIPWRWN